MPTVQIVKHVLVVQINVQMVENAKAAARRKATAHAPAKPGTKVQNATIALMDS